MSEGGKEAANHWRSMIKQVIRDVKERKKGENDDDDDDIEEVEVIEISKPKRKEDTMDLFMNRKRYQRIERTIDLEAEG